MDAKFEGKPAGDNTLLATVHHESGHAICALRLGFRVTDVAVTAPDRGYVKYEATRRSNHLHDMVISAAGHCAQARLDPQYYSQGDRASLRQIAAALSRSPRAAKQLIRWAEVEAEHLIRREWPLVCVLADALIKQRKLSGREVQKLVRRHDHDWRAALEELKRECPDWKERLAARRKKLLRGRKPRRSDIAKALVEATSTARFIPSRIYKSTVDRMVARGFGEREAVECLDEHDIFPETPP